ncbi:MAG: ABC transporter ATP-binding protein [Nitrospinota bacterium]|nr:ABC transporter ATP-binding protein [Nitrospinota bacterium]
MSGEILRAENVDVVFRYGIMRDKVHALRDFSVSVAEGDFFALLGPNGAGKSTAMYSFMGLCKIESGRIELFGKPPSPGSAMFADVAYLPEEPHYHMYLTVEEALMFYGRLYGKNGFGRAQALETLDRMGLIEFRRLPLAKCSKGMKQKVGIAQCLVGRPRLLFLDEPTRGLDPVIVKEFRDILRSIHSEGATVVLNSHILSEVETLANRAVVMRKGRALRADKMDNLLRGEKDEYMAMIGNQPGPEAAGNGALPDYALVMESNAQRGVTQVAIPAERFHEFIEFTRTSGRKVHDISLRKKTLEESVFSILSMNEESNA